MGYQTLSDLVTFFSKRSQLTSRSGGLCVTKTVIASTIGRSEGLVPLMRVYNESTRYVAQGGGKRKGSTAVYLEPWHADVESAILAQKQQGAPERLCRDLFLALWIPYIFMTRLKEALKTKKTVMWSLLDVVVSKINPKCCCQCCEPSARRRKHCAIGRIRVRPLCV